MTVKQTWTLTLTTEAPRPLEPWEVTAAMSGIQLVIGYELCRGIETSDIVTPVVRDVKEESDGNFVG